MRSILISCCAFTLASCVASASAELPLVENGAPTEGSITMWLEPQWSLGEDAEVLLGRIAQVIVDDDGNAYVLDAQLAQLHVIDPTGHWLRSIGREGEGPGEFRIPMDAFLTADGRVAVLQQQPAKIALISREGEALDDYPLLNATEGYRILLRAMASSQGMVLASASFQPNEDGSLGTQTMISAFSSHGEETAEFHRSSGGINFAEMSIGQESLDGPEQYWTVLSNDDVAIVSERDRYRIEVHAIDGSPGFAVERDVPAIEQTQAEKDAVKDNNQMVVNGREVEIIPSEFARVIDGMIPTANGGFRALLSGTAEQEQAAGRLFLLDEYDAQGRYLREIVVKSDHELEPDNLFFHGDLVFAVQSAGDDEDALEEEAEVVLSCYRLVTREVN